jgi:hypothetical protein
VALTPAQARRHSRWVEQRVYLNWLGPYFKAYHLRKAGAGGQRGLQVQLLHETGRQGALLLYDPGIGTGNFRHLYEYLGEQVLQLGYRRACADQNARRHQHLTEVTLKQLFKPAPVDCPQTGRCNQRYGLVTVDLIAVNSQPVFIRIASNAVLQPGFTPACSFDELMRAVFDAPPAGVAEQDLVAQYHASF